MNVTDEEPAVEFRGVTTAPESTAGSLATW